MTQEKKEEDKNMDSKSEEMKTEEQENQEKQEQNKQTEQNQKEQQKPETKMKQEEKIQEENQPQQNQSQKQEEKLLELKVENPQQTTSEKEDQAEECFYDASEKPEDFTANGDSVVVAVDLATVEVFEETVIFKSEYKSKMKESENINTPQTKKYEDKMIQPVDSGIKMGQNLKTPQPLKPEPELEQEKQQQSSPSSLIESCYETAPTLVKPERIKKSQQKESISVQTELPSRSPRPPAPVVDPVQTEQPVLERRHLQPEQIWLCEQGGEEEEEESCGFVCISSILPCIFAPLG